MGEICSNAGTDSANDDEWLEVDKNHSFPIQIDIDSFVPIDGLHLRRRPIIAANSHSNGAWMVRRRRK